MRWSVDLGIDIDALLAALGRPAPEWDEIDRTRTWPPS
jgi:hypothetical protein